MRAVLNAEVDPITVRSIEGTELRGAGLRVKPLIAGDAMTLMEVHYAAGSGSAPHVHDHESLVYVVSGCIRTTVGGATHRLGPGDACRHAAGEPHSVEALEDTTMIEIKSPPPHLGDLFGD